MTFLPAMRALVIMKSFFSPVEPSSIVPEQIRHSSHEIATQPNGACANTSLFSKNFRWQSSHSVDLAGWQAKMASIEIWIP